MSSEISRREALRQAGLAAGVILAATLTPPEIATAHPPSDSHQNSYQELLAPLLDKIKARRQTRPLTHLDLSFNRDLIGVLIHGLGESHEPPLHEYLRIGSHTLLSVNTFSRVANLVSWTHDIRAVGYERYLQGVGAFQNRAVKIDQAFLDPSFEANTRFSLMRQELENATGLVVDLQIVFEDDLIVNLVDRVYGRVVVNNPKAFRAAPIYLRGIKYPGLIFPQGLVELDGRSALHYIKSVVTSDEDKSLEHNQRKHRVLEALRERTNHPVTFTQTINFLREAHGRGQIQTDFELTDYLAALLNLRSLGEARRVFEGDGLIPKKGRWIYIVDDKHGDGGVQWVTANATHNPYTRRDLEAGIYGDEAGGWGYQLPHAWRLDYAANPDADDLVTGYWHPMRYWTHKLLTV